MDPSFPRIYAHAHAYARVFVRFRFNVCVRACNAFRMHMHTNTRGNVATCVTRERGGKIFHHYAYNGRSRPLCVCMSIIWC